MPHEWLRTVASIERLGLWPRMGKLQLWWGWGSLVAAGRADLYRSSVPTPADRHCIVERLGRGDEAHLKAALKRNFARGKFREAPGCGVLMWLKCTQPEVRQFFDEGRQSCLRRFNTG